MRFRCLLACCVLWLGLSVEADILKLSTGGELRGTVQLVTFLVKGVQTIYPRDEIVSVEIGKQGADVLDSRSEEKQEGKVVSVMFEAADGLRAVVRDKIAAITLDTATSLDTLKTQQKTETDAKEEEKSQLSKEQKESLLTNRALYQAYREAAETARSDGYAAVKTRHNDRVREVVRDIQRLERSIQNKILRREQASTTTRSTSGSSTYSQMSERERLERSDNLAQDQRDYERAKSTASKLKTTIHAEEKKVKEKSESAADPHSPPLALTAPSGGGPHRAPPSCPPERLRCFFENFRKILFSRLKCYPTSSSQPEPVPFHELLQGRH